MCLQIMARVWIFRAWSLKNEAYCEQMNMGGASQSETSAGSFSATMFHFWAAKGSIVLRVTGWEQELNW